MAKRIFLLFSMVLVFSCSSSDQKASKKIKLKIKGSDTVYPLFKLMATSFQQQNNNCELSVAGGGSTAGIADLIKGSIDVAATSRDLKPAEKYLIDSLKREILTYIIAYDGLAVIVNKQNTIEKITREQLEDIYQGKITNWKEIGGMREKINVYSLNTNNSIDEFFRDKIMGEKKYFSGVTQVNQLKDMLKKVVSNKGAIGYANIQELSAKVNYISVSFDTSKTYIAPNAFNFQNRSYPISRALYFFADASKEAEMKLFNDYAQSLLGKRNISEMGFIPPQ
ncbi:MAG: PstS family phosphate ABC transporter substrate-binding protein [Bacteroidetes bacterium]|nr:PstS family phosphate ABC transporter substrate-binding protein [Bacteroidota bacterium]